MTVKHHYRLLQLCMFGGGLLCLDMTGYAAEGGLGITPGIVLIEDAPVGQVLDLGARGLHITMMNGSDQEAVFGLNVVAPKADEIQTYEAGYEPIPDTSWVHLDSSMLTVPSHGAGAAGITLNIPDRPELYNRHFMIFIDGGPSLKHQIGAVLHVRARIMLETTVTPAKDGLEHGGEIAVAPGRVTMLDQHDGTWSEMALIRNNGATEGTFDVLTLRQAYGVGLENRRARFFGGSHSGLVDQDWATCDQTTFTIAPGAVKVLHLVGKPTRPLKADERVDEVLFIARRATDDVPEHKRRHLGDRDYAHCELLRLTYSSLVSAPAPVPGPVPVPGRHP